VGSEPHATEFGNGAAYVVDDGDGRVGRIDAASGALVASAHLGESVSGIDVDGARVYVAADDGVVVVADAPGDSPHISTAQPHVGGVACPNAAKLGTRS
jgi:hypothetical protein